MMERLTFEGNFCDIAQCAEIPGGSFCENGSCSQRRAWERLKAYEDTGLTPKDLKAHFTEETVLKLCGQLLGIDPDRLRELAKADKDGRLVVLPCKAGDTVWFRTWDQNGRVDLGIQPHEVADTRAYVIVRGKYADVGISVEQFGKTAFLACEAAEAALKEHTHE